MDANPDPLKLRKSQTGFKELPRCAYQPDVARWVQDFAERDIDNAKTVEVYSSFEEDAYRFVFAYEDSFPRCSPQLVTVLPTGKIENDQRLEPEKEKALIAYTYAQDMDPDVAQPFLTDPTKSKFVWQRPDLTCGVLQTWPAKFNETFKKEFTIDHQPNNPDEDESRFEPQALEEFKKVMQNLFEVRDAETPLPLHCAYKRTHNEKAIYKGTGDALMSLLRINGKLRRELDIVALVEPDGFKCKFKRPKEKDEKKREGTKVFHMDITLDYCLYTKQGWEIMACVKPLNQFMKEATFKDTSMCVRINKQVDDEAISYPLPIDWFSPEALKWVLRSLIFSWTCAFGVVCLRIVGLNMGWNLVHDTWVLIGVAAVAASFGVFADFAAMKWCLIPWLQRVQRMNFLSMDLPFSLWMPLQLLSTASQIFTIQANAWFMMDAITDSNMVKCLWGEYWSISSFHSIPEYVWTSYLTTAAVAVFCWLLSTFQLTIPLMMGVPATRLFCNSDNKECPFAARHNGDCKPLLDSAHPEAFYFDFQTIWGRICSKVGHTAKKRTFHESVAMLSLASGQRYIGSTSISYPKTMVKEIITFQRGYKMKKMRERQVIGFEPLTQGWEMRALREFHKISQTLSKRLFFIMTFKLALQMNLQISLFLFARLGKIQEMQTFDSDGLFHDILNRKIVPGDFTALVSIASLIANLMSELFDIFSVVTLFRDVRLPAMQRIQDIKSDNEVYCYDDFKEDETGETRRITYYGKDLKEQYWEARRTVCIILFVTFFNLWLIGYAILKFVGASFCKEGAWSVHQWCAKLECSHA